MPEYDDTNRGVLFSNKEKQAENANAPAYKGNINVDGKEFWLSAWVNKSQRTGVSYMSLSLQPKEDVPQQQADVKTEAQVDAEGFDQVIPF